MRRSAFATEPRRRIRLRAKAFELAESGAPPEIAQDTRQNTPLDALSERTAREYLRLAQRQVGRIPIPYVLIDVFVCWMLSRLNLLGPGLLWLGMLVLVQVWRWRYVKALQARPPADATAALKRLSAMLLVLGLLRGSLVPVIFLHPVQAEHYMFTLIYLGLLAGTCASVGGLVWPFIGWGALACGSLAVAWVLQGNVDGVWLGLLIVALIAVLTGHVRDQGVGLRLFVKLACDNEILAQSLRAARDQSEAASLSKTRFFAAASHDLRQPLHALSINATTLELLARRQSDELIKELSHSINRALNQSNGLLDSLLEISNLDADAVKPQMQNVDLGAMLNSVREEFSALAAQKGLQLKLDLPDPAPVARTDPDLLRRILHNLVGNALKFSSSGNVTLSARSTMSSEAARAHGGEGRIDRIRLAVIDTGPGIEPQEQEHVFEEFYQIGNASRDRSKGLGLGLSIVKRTAALLGSDVGLYSVMGEGTRFELNLAPAPAGSRPQLKAASESRLEVGMLPGLRVLVVDDEEEILRSMHGLLTQLGCDVRCAPDGDEAMALLTNDFVPQVLLIDHRLRNESGIDVIARLGELLGPVSAVLVTGDTEPATLQIARAAGHRVIHKPVQGHLLAQTLREAAQATGVH
jgi:signal transduction histidine kinase